MLTSDIDSEATAASESTPCFAPSDQCSQTKIRVKLGYLTPGWWARERKNQWFSVNSRWSNYLLSLHSFQSERRAWLNEYNPLILFCSLIEKAGNVLMRLDRCWESGLILLIALYSPNTLPCIFHSVSQTDKVQHVLPNTLADSAASYCFFWIQKYRNNSGALVQGWPSSNHAQKKADLMPFSSGLVFLFLRQWSCATHLHIWYPVAKEGWSDYWGTGNTGGIINWNVLGTLE